MALVLGGAACSFTMVRRVHTVQIDSQSAQSWPSNSAPEEDGYIEPI